jgi:hypothetical protein
LREQVARYEAGLVEEALKQTGGNVRAAAKILEISERNLHYKLAQGQAQRPKVKATSRWNLERMVAGIAEALGARIDAATLSERLLADGLHPESNEAPGAITRAVLAAQHANA